MQLLNWYKCDPEEIIIIYDDTDLPSGKVRFRSKGSAGTHNGMRSIVELTGRTDIPRLRVGIGRPPEYMELADFVLSRPAAEYKEAIDNAISKAADAAEVYLTEGLQSIQAYLGKGNEL